MVGEARHLAVAIRAHEHLLRFRTRFVAAHPALVVDTACGQSMASGAKGSDPFANPAQVLILENSSNADLDVSADHKALHINALWQLLPTCLIVCKSIGATRHQFNSFCVSALKSRITVLAVARAVDRFKGALKTQGVAFEGLSKSTPWPVPLRHATTSLFHQRHVGRLHRSSCGFRPRQSSRKRIYY